jgi:hypothetical protein
VARAGRRQRGRHAVTEASSSADNRRLAARIIAVLLAAVALLYLYLAWVTSGQADLWILTTIDGAQLFTIDDAYRYFLARTAWHDSQLYHWNYVLPVALLADGIFASLINGSLFGMRALHIPGAVATLWFTWQSGLLLGIGRRWLLLAVVLLALMPVYAFVFLSFYGESWLALALMAGVWCLLGGRIHIAALCFALLPLIRPEGIYFVVPLGLYWMYQRRWLAWLLLGAPGFFYGLYLLWQLESLTHYTEWRLALMAILHQGDHPALYQGAGFFSTFNPLWTVPALLAIGLPVLRRLLPVYAGMLIYMAVLLSLVLAQQALHEARYYVSILPLLTLSFAASCDVLSQRLTSYRREVSAALVLLTLLVIAEHFLQMDPWKHAAGNQRWPLAGIPSGTEYFPALSRQANGRRRDIATSVEALVQHDPRIDRVLIQNTEIFYHLNPAIVDKVPVSYVPTNEAVAAERANGLFYAMHSDGKHYAFYRLRRAQYDDRRVAVYVGRLSGMALTPVFSAGVFTVYLVGYDEVPAPALQGRRL